MRILFILVYLLGCGWSKIPAEKVKTLIYKGKSIETQKLLDSLYLQADLLEKNIKKLQNQSKNTGFEMDRLQKIQSEIRHVQIEISKKNPPAKFSPLSGKQSLLVVSVTGGLAVVLLIFLSLKRMRRSRSIQTTPLAEFPQALPESSFSKKKSVNQISDEYPDIVQQINIADESPAAETQEASPSDRIQGHAEIPNEQKQKIKIKIKAEQEQRFAAQQFLETPQLFRNTVKRDVLRLKEEGLSHREISKKLNISQDEVTFILQTETRQNT